MKKILLMLALGAMFVPRVFAAVDATGTWQGTLTPPDGKSLRIVMKVTSDGGKLKAQMFSIDQTGLPFNATSVSLQDTDIKIVVDAYGGVYEGKISADGKTMTGTWTQGVSMPLIMVRATTETAWDIPAPPPPPKQLPADADPSLAVATIKPNPSGINSMQGLNTNGHDFRVRNGSLLDLIGFAYNVQVKQVVGGPSWIDEDRYDIDARQDQDGFANEVQLRGMVRKLLEDRFQLKIHHDKREMAAFVITVSKAGAKLTQSDSKVPLPGMGYRPVASGVMMRINNGTTDELAEFMQATIFDRPVVNRTAIEGRYDMRVTFTPDDSEFKGHPPKLPTPAAGGATGTAAETVEAAPGLFEAMEKQLGLKLTSEKAQVDAIVIDHVDHPSAN